MSRSSSRRSLRTLRLRIPGQWADGWLYREHLLLWTRDNSLYAIGLDDLRRQVSQKGSKAHAALADYLIFRNDWKASEQFQRSLEIPGVELAYTEALQQVRTFDVDVSNMRPVSYDTPDGLPLDSVVYANRAFTATTTGLFECRFQPSFEDDLSPTETCLEARVSAVTARYLSVNCSTQQNGLMFSPMYVGDYSDEHETSTGQFIEVVQSSTGNSWAGHNVLNYTGEDFPLLLRAYGDYERTSTQARFDDWRATGYESPIVLERLANTALRTAQRTTLSDVQFEPMTDERSDVVVLGNSSYRLLVSDGGRLRVLNLASYHNREPYMKLDSGFDAPRSKLPSAESILSVSGLGSGFVAELDNELRLLTPFGSHSLARVRAARVRTFQQSRRHRDSVLVVEEQAVSLIGFLEHALVR